MEQSVIVAHPGKQHSYRLASALKKHGLLLKYGTTIYNKKDNLIALILSRISKFGISSLIKKRKNADLDDQDVILYNTVAGILEALLFRIDKSHSIYTAFQQYNAKSFGRKIAKFAITSKAKAVICYDSNAFECFAYLKKNCPSITRIMDVSHCARPFEKRIIDDEVLRTSNTELLDESPYLKNSRFLERMQNEINDTDFFLSPSSFITRSLIYCGVSKDKILTIPYGSNAQNIDCQHREGAPLNVLFVGNVNYNKGITYLIDAVSMYDPCEVQLTIVGLFNEKKEYVRSHKDNIVFTGKLDFADVCEIYRASDILVIDSFAEGLAQVGLEAMSCGIPIICSTNSGVNDAVIDGENGFIIEPGNLDQLKEALDRFLQHRELIDEMGKNARKASQNYTWLSYEENVANKIREIVETQNGKSSFIK